MDMADKNILSEPSVESAVDNKKVTCHLVSLPRIVLTRIDEKLHMTKKGSHLKTTPLKRLGTQNISKQVKSKTVLTKDATLSKEKLHRNPGRPKKKQLATKFANIKKRNVLNKDNSTLKKTARTITKCESETKNLLKKTMLQKRSKVAIPPAKKSKLIPTKPKKLVPSNPNNPITPNKKANTPTPKPKKETVPNIKLDVPPTAKPFDSDTSEDEFLYDELIEELENAPVKQSRYLQPSSEKTTNITLKPNIGNKPPTVVKGGIVKKTNLPADLQPIASPNVIHSKEDYEPVKSILGKKKRALLGKNKRQNSSWSPVPTKKPSPWPISVTSPSKTNLKSTQKNTSATKAKSSNISNVSKSSKLQQTKSKVLPEPISLSVNSINDIVSKPTPMTVVKPKFGPKQTAKVTPLSKSLTQDDNLSDEYTEEETLENVDYEPLGNLSKPGNESNLTVANSQDVKDTHLKKTAIVKFTKDDADPNLDLLRILTDDTDDAAPSKPIESHENDLQTRTMLNTTTQNPHTNGEKSSSMILSNHTEEDSPPARTIYDLMNEVSLQYPSWNLHIIPETNAFCIAQVTKGRLGLPTLKKCIELDPVDYNAKVYIHQYHIKRFDGVYDSEESIIALIQEINSIKA